MNVYITSDAEEDLLEGYWFYERQSPGLGDYFGSCLIADIVSLAFFAAVHEVVVTPAAWKIFKSFQPNAECDSVRALRLPCNWQPIQSHFRRT